MDVFISNPNYEVVKVVDTFKSMIWTDRYDECGDFELYCPVDPSLFFMVKQNDYVEIKDSDRTMIIEDIQIDSDVEHGSHILFTGRSLESILERRIVWGEHFYYGKLQDIVKQLITENIINPVDPDRKIPNFVFEESTDPLVTEVLVEDIQYNGEDLYFIISTLCKEHQLGFRIVKNDQNQFVFKLYAGIDRSYTQNVRPFVIFAPSFENLINSDFYTSIADMKTITLVTGEVDNVVTQIVVGEGTGLDRREIFTDARGVSTRTEGGSLSTEQYHNLLINKGLLTLYEHGLLQAFEGKTDATKMFVYGTDFFIGDIVQIANEYGFEGRVYISELVISQTENEFSIYPTFKTAMEPIPEEEGGTT